MDSWLNTYHKLVYSKLNKYLKAIKSKKHNVHFTGKFSKGISKENTVSKLLEILDKKKLLIKYKNMKLKF